MTKVIGQSRQVQIFNQQKNFHSQTKTIWILGMEMYS